jgi:hypothetical protein
MHKAIRRPRRALAIAAVLAGLVLVGQTAGALAGVPPDERGTQQGHKAQTAVTTAAHPGHGAQVDPAGATGGAGGAATDQQAPVAPAQPVPPTAQHSPGVAQLAILALLVMVAAVATWLRLRGRPRPRQAI